MAIEVCSSLSRNEVRRMLKRQLQADLSKTRTLRRVMADPHGRVVEDDLRQYEGSVQFYRRLLQKT